MRWILDQLVRQAKVPVEIRSDPALFRPTDEPDNRSDISRLRALGFEAQYPMERTITDALDFWRRE